MRNIVEALVYLTEICKRTEMLELNDARKEILNDCYVRIAKSLDNIAEHVREKIDWKKGDIRDN